MNCPQATSPLNMKDSEVVSTRLSCSTLPGEYYGVVVGIHTFPFSSFRRLMSRLSLVEEEVPDGGPRQG